ncbi:EAL domain-containing protein [uncultured Lamprocystis sp.]|jgi:EAL domain-containing protein (putative c-di-GMP-specific phosphodiesterase class I)/ActR/RegA family two-component response regulator/GGDEF domain-containing protein|uniref:EAL domain-containing protein n=1 Tax=uncultured Lamprocystis sp. TaxID=543132 RepID=UPI0025E76E94|nr:EAL domain-containing protein [uncultured Lamprocystis sp.]
MPDTSSPVGETVFYFGVDLTLLRTLRDHLGARSIAVRAVRTLAGLMLAADGRPVPILILEPGILRPGRSVKAILERLEKGTGLRPRLICLVGAAPSAEPVVYQCPDAVMTLAAPWDGTRIAEQVVALMTADMPRQGRVLVVDALAAECLEIVATLRRGGVLVEHVADLHQVIPALEGFPCDLILLDLNLHQDDHRELAATIRAHAAADDLPIVFLSAEASPEHHGEVLHLGEDDYLARPLDYDQLLATVRGRIDQVRASERSSQLVPGTRGARDRLLLSRTQLIKRLDHAILVNAGTDSGQAVLCIRLDGSPVLGAAEETDAGAFGSLVTELIRSTAGVAQRAACAGEGELLLWVGCASNGAVVALAEAIHQAAGALVVPPRAGVARVSLSIGIGTLLPSVDNALTLLSRAQSACETAQRAGGDRVLVHRTLDDPAMSGGEFGDTPLLRLLQRALAGSGFELVYQPILSLHKAHQERYEVLLRLRTPQGDIIPPLAFLPVARRCGLLPDLDRWVLSAALRTLRQERDAGRRTRLMIHQCAASLAEPGWLQWVRDEILRLDLIRQRPVLEFNAVDLLADEDQARLLFPELGRLGIEVCLAGVTDSEDMLGLIARRPIGTAKLARELASRETGARLRLLVQALHQRGAQVIAAGIEDPAVIGRIWSSGVDYIQGNFIQFPEDTLSFNFQEGVIGSS